MDHESPVPDLTVSVGGRPIPPEALAAVSAVHVHEDLDAQSMVTLELDNWDPDRLAVTWSDSPVFAPGGEVTICLGYVDDLHPVITASITGLEPEFGEEPPRLTVRGHDHRHLLARGRRTRAFAAAKDSTIAETIARDAGLRADVADSGIVHELVVQADQSDLELLRHRAELIGFEFFVRDRVLHFHPSGEGGRPAQTLHVEQDLTAFTPRLSTLHQAGSAQVRGWDMMRKQELVGTAAAAVLPAAGGEPGPRAADRAYGRETAAWTVDVAPADQAVADQVARGSLLARSADYVRGEGSCAGRPDLRSGTVVQITGAGDRFSGPYYVTAVRHSLTSDQGFTTDFDVRRRAVSDVG